MLQRKIYPIWYVFWFLTVIWEEQFFYRWYNCHRLVLECICGNVKKHRLWNLTKKQWTISCWCHKNRMNAERLKTHWMSKTTENRIWSNMKDRCFNERNHAYKDYGGRGIIMCDRWVENFQNFYDDMWPRPKGKSLDRINNDWNYCKENCRWATQTEQCNNTRKNLYIEYDWEKLTATEWSRRLWIKWAWTIKKRLHRWWTIEQTVTTWPERWPYMRNR